MTKDKLPTFDASYWSPDPRFVEVNGILYPVLLTDMQTGAVYEERLGEFAGYRTKFVDAAEKLQIAALANRLPAGDWSLVGLYDISAIQSYDEPFVCRVGERVARLREV